MRAFLAQCAGVAAVQGVAAPCVGVDTCPHARRGDAACVAPNVIFFHLCLQVARLATQAASDSIAQQLKCEQLCAPSRKVQSPNRNTAHGKPACVAALGPQMGRQVRHMQKARSMAANRNRSRTTPTCSEACWRYLAMPSVRRKASLTGHCKPLQRTLRHAHTDRRHPRRLSLQRVVQHCARGLIWLQLKLLPLTRTCSTRVVRASLCSCAALRAAALQKPLRPASP